MRPEADANSRLRLQAQINRHSFDNSFFHKFDVSQPLVVF